MLSFYMREGHDSSSRVLRKRNAANRKAYLGTLAPQNPQRTLGLRIHAEAFVVDAIGCALPKSRDLSGKVATMYPDAAVDGNPTEYLEYSGRP